MVDLLKGIVQKDNLQNFISSTDCFLWPSDSSLILSTVKIWVLLSLLWGLLFHVISFNFEDRDWKKKKKKKAEIKKKLQESNHNPIYAIIQVAVFKTIRGVTGRIGTPLGSGSSQRVLLKLDLQRLTYSTSSTNSTSWLKALLLSVARKLMLSLCR